MAEGTEMDHLRIGILYPSDGVHDREFWQFAPPHATMHVTRIFFPETPATTLVNDGDLDQAAQLLRPIGPAAIAYACTSASFEKGHAGDRSIIDRISRAANAPGTSTSSALVAACRSLGVRKLALGAPYLPETTAQFVRYLAEAGLEPLSSRSLGLEGGIGELESEGIVRLANEVDVPQAEAIVLACTNLVTYSAISALERALDKPVITANQATVWHACRIGGYRGTEGVGRLWSVDAIENPIGMS
ncbi:arylmalonate decarboxylase [Mesorhizobium sp.]|uniref:maleate cis-trans isomerase family protein n=2 Tax=Mesorhizobium TaxID=68287 RepID=UPI0025EC3B98|nr:arylmalonate decarboxylase [Mesorhizobium sp.]